MKKNPNEKGDVKETMVGYVTLMRNGMTDMELEKAEAELKALYERPDNVFTGLILFWREIRGKTKGEKLLCGDPNVQELGDIFSTKKKLSVYISFLLHLCCSVFFRHFLARF